MDNPFKFGGIVTGAHFADREGELSELLREMQNLNRVFLISPRRFGKTCLLFNLMARLREMGFATAYLDLNACPDLPALAAFFAHAALTGLESSTDKMIKILSGLRRLRPRVAVGPDGSLSAGVEMLADRNEALPALLEAMHRADSLAGERGKKLVVAIDEFSDLPKYDGETLEKGMRSAIQQHAHTGYIFSGSAQSVMLAMTRDRRRAFYKLGRLLTLGPIDPPVYEDFIRTWFRKGERETQPGTLGEILEHGEDVPYNVQRICHVLWESSRETRLITPALAAEAPHRIARQDSAHYELLWQTATLPQRNLLIALANEPLGRPFSRDFQLKHGVGPSSSIKGSLDSLEKKGILDRSPAGSYRFCDTFLRHWITRLGKAGP